MAGDNSYKFIKSRFNVFYGQTFVKVCDLFLSIEKADPCQDYPTILDSQRAKFVNGAPYPIVFSFDKPNQILNGIAYYFDPTLEKLAPTFTFKYINQNVYPFSDWKCNWISGSIGSGNITCAIINGGNNLNIWKFNLTQISGKNWEYKLISQNLYDTLPDAGELKQFDFYGDYLVLRSVRKSNGLEVVIVYSNSKNVGDNVFWTVDIDPLNHNPQIFVWQKDDKTLPELVILDNKATSASYLDSGLAQAKPTSNSLVLRRNTIGHLKLKLTQKMSLYQLGKILIQFSKDPSAPQNKSELTLKSFFVIGSGSGPGARPGPKPSPSNKPGGGMTELIIWIVVISLLVIILIIIIVIVILRKRNGEDLNSSVQNMDIYEATDDGPEMAKEEAKL